MINTILMSTLAMLGPVALVAQDRPAVQPRVEVWLNDNGTFQQGDRMRVFFRTDMDAYVTVVRVTTEGHVRILFPETPIENNFVAGGAEYEIVQFGREDYRVHDDPGNGYVFAVASTVPFDYTAYSAGAVWDYHLLAFEGEEERDPYDTFAHFMDDIVAPESIDFAFEAVAYSVDERGSRYYGSNYRYWSVPYYQDCHVYRAFYGLRSYYRYSYNCATIGVHIIFGSYGHYYHDDYYHYGYRGYDTYYYGAGSVYRYRYVGGGYRHDHGARRVSREVYSGLGRHSQPNPRADGNGRVIYRNSPTSPTTRRTVPQGTPVRTGNRPTARRIGALTPPGATENRRVAEPATRQPSESSTGRRTPATTSSPGETTARPTPRTSSGGLTRRVGTTSPTRSPDPAQTGSTTPQRRETSPRPTSGGGTVESPSTARRTPSASPPSRSQPSTTRRTPTASPPPRSQPSTTRRTPSASPPPRSQPSTTRRTPSASPPPRSQPSPPRPSAGSSSPRSSGSPPARSPSRRRPGT